MHFQAMNDVIISFQNPYNTNKYFFYEQNSSVSTLHSTKFSVDYFSKDSTCAGIGRKNKSQREKYKATTANGQNFRHTTYKHDYYIFYTLLIWLVLA